MIRKAHHHLPPRPATGAESNEELEKLDQYSDDRAKLLAPRTDLLAETGVEGITLREDLELAVE